MNLLERFDSKLLLPLQESVSGKLDWFDQDSQKLYEKNLKIQSKSWYYRDKVVEYNINTAGYRTKEFNCINWSKSIVIFGCSMVFGVGNAEEDTISGQLEKITGIPTVNLGSPGASSSYSVHNSLLLKEYYPEPKYIVNIWTSPYRRTYYTNDSIINCGSWNAEKEKFGYYWSKNIHNAHLNLKFDYMTSKNLWKNYCDITLFSVTSEILNCEYVKTIDLARDLSKSDKNFIGHPGKETNKIVAQRIANLLRL